MENDLKNSIEKVKNDLKIWEEWLKDDEYAVKGVIQEKIYGLKRELVKLESLARIENMLEGLTEQKESNWYSSEEIGRMFNGGDER